jgi:DHA2 family multidrug resistance protein
VIAGGLLDALGTVRRHFHSNHLVDSLGNAPLIDDNTAAWPGAFMTRPWC